MIRKKGYEMKDYAAWLKAWETYNLHFYSVPAWLILALVFSLIAGIAFAVARGLAKKEQPDRPGLLVNAMLVVSLAFGMVGGLAFLQSIRITAEMFKEPFTAVSEPLKFGSRLEKDTGVNGLSCGTSLDLTVMPADGTYDCRYLDGHGTLHRDATLVVDGTKAGLYNGHLPPGKTTITSQAKGKHDERFRTADHPERSVSLPVDDFEKLFSCRQWFGISGARKPRT